MFDIYKNKRVLITGHTGFKGSWLSLWLKKAGAYVIGYSLLPESMPNMFYELGLAECIDVSITGDILDEKRLNDVFYKYRPDIVFHLAAQPIVRRSYFEPVLTYKTNVIGTLNVLEAARKTNSTKVFINVTTDKCYENKETMTPYKEDDSMGGYDMYSSSKGCSEILSSSYRRSFLDDGYLLSTARAGNVIGGGDWAKDRLIPDCIRQINACETIDIRCPNAIRPWQHVLEPLSGYLLLGERLLMQDKTCIGAFNFGPDSKADLSVIQVARKIVELYQKGTINVNKKDNLHEASILKLDIKKAKDILNWEPAYNADTAIEKTVAWYKNFYENKNIREFTLNQIDEYERSIKWKTPCAIK